jgi:hypothetical protein
LLGCGHELPTTYTIKFCYNCGQEVKEENKIAEYTRDGNPVYQTNGQEGIPSKVPTTDSKAITEAPKPVEDSE